MCVTFFQTQHVLRACAPHTVMSLHHPPALHWCLQEAHQSDVEFKDEASKADEQSQRRGGVKAWVTPRKGKGEDEKVKADVPLWQLIYVPIFITRSSLSLFPLPWPLNLGGIQIKWCVRVCMSGRDSREREKESNLCLAKPILKFLLHYADAFERRAQLRLQISACWILFLHKEMQQLWSGDVVFT